MLGSNHGLENRWLLTEWGSTPPPAASRNTIMHYNFNQDIVDGEEGEKRVASLLCDKCDAIISVKHNNDNKYDWKIDLDNGDSITVEVKSDMMIGRTGNFAFETRCRGKDSGINVTQSDLFVVYCHENNKEHAYAFRTEYVRNLVKYGNYSLVSGGDKDKDGNPVTEMVLVPKDDVYRDMSDITVKASIDLRKFAKECRKV